MAPVSLTTRWSARRPIITRVGIPIVLGALALGQLTHSRAELGHPAPDVWAGLLIVLTVVPLVARERYAFAALVASTIPAIAYAALTYRPTIAFLAPMICLYHVGLRGDRAQTIRIGVLTAVVVAAAKTIITGETIATTQTLAIVALIAFPLVVGDATQFRRAYVAELMRRVRDAEQTRDEEAQRRVQEERLRIARDLHDVVAHTISTINVQAGAAAHVLAKDPAQAEPALRAITASSKEALDELRGLLGVLRSADNGEAPLQPTPNLADVDALVEELRQTGTDVHLDTTGDPPIGLPEPVEVAAYRILQEACTNVARHADTARTEISITYRADHLELRVANAAPSTGSRTNGSGVGILGMRERAALLGGHVDAHATVAGGFEVVARLPYRHSS